MKQTINSGAYGWRHTHWTGMFYPDDLPTGDDEDWRLSYYSNEFNAVMVPVDYWLDEQSADCEDWLDSVHDKFQFFVQCHASMLEMVSLTALSRELQILAPQLSALVLLGDCQRLSDDIKNPFIDLADLLQCELFTTGNGSSQRGIWRPGENRTISPESTPLAFVENDLSDLRSARVLVEQFAAQLKDEDATIIVNHPQLQAIELSKFKSMLEVMGY